MHTHWVAMCSVLENFTIPENTKPGFFMQNSVILEASQSQEHYSGSTKSKQLKLLKSVIKENFIRNSDTLSWNLSYKDGSMRRNAATAYPKPLVCSQRVARESKEVELFRQVVILGMRLLISRATLQQIHQRHRNLLQNLSHQHHKKD